MCMKCMYNNKMYTQKYTTYRNNMYAQKELHVQNISVFRLN